MSARSTQIWFIKFSLRRKDGVFFCRRTYILNNSFTNHINKLYNNENITPFRFAFSVDNNSVGVSFSKSKSLTVSYTFLNFHDFS